MERGGLFLVLSLSMMLYGIEGVFLDQPQNATVVEPNDATFHCSVFNSSFTILWLVNGSDTDFAEFQDRGLTVNLVNNTASELVIIGYKKNSNTLVQCVALQYENYRLANYIYSDEALLVVQDQGHFIRPWQLSSYFTIVYAVTQSKQALLSSPNANPPLLDLDQGVIGGLAAAGGVLAVSVAILITLCIYIYWKKIGKSPEICDDMKRKQNDAYEYRIPMKSNSAYEYCQRNIHACL